MDRTERELQMNSVEFYKWSPDGSDLEYLNLYSGNADKDSC